MERTDLLLSFLREKGFENLIVSEDGTFLQYTSTRDELEALYSGLSCRDVSNHTQLLFHGHDALDFLHRISTNALKDLQPKQVKRTLFTNEKGRLLESALVAHLGDAFLLLGNKDKSKLLQFWCSKYIIADDVVVHNSAKESKVFEFRGEQVPALFILLFGDAAKNLRTDAVTLADYNMAPVWIIPEVCKEESVKYYLWAKSSVLLQILTECFDAGKMYDFTLVGETAYEQYRLEHGIPGAREIDDRYNPHETGLTDFVSFTKGCYIGQEVIARIDTYQKTQKSLRSFVIQEPLNNVQGLTLYNVENEEIGSITSSAFSDRLKKTVGLGYIKKDFVAEGTTVKAVAGNTHFPVMVKLPGKLHENIY